MKTITTAFALILFAFACKKEQTSAPVATTPYHVRLTDAPGAYQQVNVDIQSVQVTGQGQTISLKVNPGIYNLLDFANGADTLIATGGLTLQKVQQIRFILGSNNSVMADSVLYPLEVSSGSQSGLKINVHHSLQPGVAYEVLLDFDAHQSVVETGNGKFQLKPVIRAVEKAISGSITGTLSPTGVSAVIAATNTSGGYSTVADTVSGAFLIQGVPAGTYSVQIVPAAPHNSVNINGVNVVNGSPVSVGTVTI